MIFAFFSNSCVFSSTPPAPFFSLATFSYTMLFDPPTQPHQALHSIPTLALQGQCPAQKIVGSCRMGLWMCGAGPA